MACNISGSNSLSSPSVHRVTQEVVIEALVDACILGDQAAFTLSLAMCLEIGADVDKPAVNGLTALFTACSVGRTAIVDQLLCAGANKDAAILEGDFQWETPLSIASKHGYEGVVEQLLHAGAARDLAFDKYEAPFHIACRTPLYIACRYGHVTVVDRLLKAGASLEAADVEGFTPLHAACQWKHEAVVERLLAAGAKIDATSCDGRTPLYEASRLGHDDIVKQLLEAGAATEAGTLNGLTPLHVACQSGHAAVVERLLAEGANKEALENLNGFTPLMMACHFGYITIVERLLQAGVNKDVADTLGFTSLHRACNYGHLAVVEQLLKAGALLEAANAEGFTPLHVACERGHLDVVKRLFAVGAAKDARTSAGETLLTIACINGQAAIVTWLLRAGAAIGATDAQGFTPLHHACRYGHEAVVDLLLRSGAAIDGLTLSGNTPLYWACQNEALGVIDQLLKAGASVNTPDFLRETPLHVACFKGNDKMVTQLVAAGAEINAVSRGGSTPLSIACQNHFSGCFNIVQLLLARGAYLNAATQDDADSESLLVLNRSVPLSKNLADWILQLKKTKDHLSPSSRAVLVSRLMKVLTFAIKSQPFREVLERSVIRSLGSCQDGGALTLNRLEMQRKIRECSNPFSKEGIRLFRGFVAMALLKEIANRKVTELVSQGGRYIDWVEIYLKYQICLKVTLDLPVDCIGMQFGAPIDEDDLKSAAQEILGQLGDLEKLAPLIAKQKEWRKQLNSDPIFFQEKKAVKAAAYDAASEAWIKLEKIKDQFNHDEYFKKSKAILDNRKTAIAEWYRQKTLSILQANGEALSGGSSSADPQFASSSHS